MFLRYMKHKPVKLLEIGLGCTMNTGSASILLWQVCTHGFSPCAVLLADAATCASWCASR
jgi:hypothetical protein